MKYFYIGLGVLAALLILSIAGSALLCRSTQEPERLLRDADAALLADDFPAAAALAGRAARAFDRRRALLSSLLSHEELDEIAIGFSDLEVYAAEGSREEFRAHCKELQFRLRHIAEMDLPFYYNFL